MVASDLEQITTLSDIEMAYIAKRRAATVSNGAICDAVRLGKVTQTQIARRLGISQSSVSQIVRRNAYYPTNWSALNDEIGGGLRGGDFIIIAGWYPGANQDWINTFLHEIPDLIIAHSSASSGYQIDNIPMYMNPESISVMVIEPISEWRAKFPINLWQSATLVLQLEFQPELEFSTFTILKNRRGAITPVTESITGKDKG